MIGYSGFISYEWFLIAWGVDTYTHAYLPTSRTKAFSRNQVHAWFKKKEKEKKFGKSLEPHNLQPGCFIRGCRGYDIHRNWLIDSQATHKWVKNVNHLLVYITDTGVVGSQFLGHCIFIYILIFYLKL